MKTSEMGHTHHVADSVSGEEKTIPKGSGRKSKGQGPELENLVPYYKTKILP